MKKLLTLCLLTLSTIALLSWGFQGHRTVALIAERHLTPQAKAAINELLDGNTIANVASWADEVRNEPEYRKTASWHFLNEPTGLSETQFIAAVKSQPNENVYTAILAQEKILKDAAATKEQKNEALKFLIHFVGDLHQPMHISRAEDKGGNTIQVRFDDKGTNLHSLWDSKLLDHQNIRDEELAIKLDKASAAQVRKWQSSNPLQWLWESYQISSKLYQETEGNNKLVEDYYTSHIGIVNDRLERAGIRLAGVLNAVFKDYKTGHVEEANTDSLAIDITLNALKAHYSEEVFTQGKVYGYKDMGSFVLVNVGEAYPNQLLTVVLRGSARKLAATVDGKSIRISGKVINYQGKPEIEVRDSRAIEIIQP
jgi:hypothetical protein